MINTSPPPDEALAKAMASDQREVGHLMYRLDILAHQFGRLIQKNPKTFEVLAERAIALNKPTLQNCYWQLREAADFLMEQIPDEDLEADTPEVSRKDAFLEHDPEDYEANET